MLSLSIPPPGFKNDFSVVTDSFLQTPGLPFASVLDAESIEHIFREEAALFAQDDIFSTQIVLWAFLAQTLRDGKGVACASAVADIAAYMLQTDQQPPCGDTGDYCRAPAKLSLRALQRLVRASANPLEAQAPAAWLWKGRHAKLVDGFTFTMPDTEANQEAFPQISVQRPGVGLPTARVCAVVSLATAGICDLALGPFKGKETGENALLRELLDTFDANDVIVFDRHYGSYMILALLAQRGLQVCTRLHQRRPRDFRRGRRLGPDDHLITCTRPKRPGWMPQEQYDQMPETLTLREVRFQVTAPGRPSETITIVTTLTDRQAYSREDLAELYGFRWNVELDIRHQRGRPPPGTHRAACAQTTPASLSPHAMTARSTPRRTTKNLNSCENNNCRGQCHSPQTFNSLRGVSRHPQSTPLSSLPDRFERVMIHWIEAATADAALFKIQAAPLHALLWEWLSPGDARRCRVRHTPSALGCGCVNEFEMPR